MRTALPTSIRRLLADDVIRRYLAIAALAGTLDGLTKMIAVRGLGAVGLIDLTDRLSLLLVWNLGAAGGVSLGPLTAHLNVLITVLALVLVTTVVRPLGALSSHAPTALGFVSGGAVGNLVSIVSGPKGVADFLGVHLAGDTMIVANVADLFLWSGALLLVPVFATLVSRLMAERRGVPVVPAPVVTAALSA